MSYQGYHSYGRQQRAYSDQRPPRMIIASPRSTTSSRKPSIQTYPPVNSAALARHPLITNRINRKDELVKIRLKKNNSHSRSKPVIQPAIRNDHNYYQHTRPKYETSVLSRKYSPPIQKNTYYEESRDSDNHRDYSTRRRRSSRRRRKSPMRSLSDTYTNIKQSFSSDSSRSSRDSNVRRVPSNNSGSWKGSSGSRGSRNSSRHAIKRKYSSDSEESYSNNRGRFSNCPYNEAVEENWPIVVTVLLCGVFLSLG